MSAPARDRTGETRRHVLDCARQSVLRLGVSRTSMMEISRRSGVGRTTLYRYWPDLDSLLGEMLTGELVAVMGAVDADARDASALAETICRIADEIRRNPVLQSLRENEPELVGTYVFERLGTSQHAILDELSTRVAEVARTDPALAGRDARATAAMLLLTVQGAVLAAPIADPPLDPATWRTELLRLLKGYLGS